MSTNTAIAPYIHSFLADFLTCQRGMSINTIRSYRDVLKSLLLFASREKKRPCTQLTVEQIDVDLVLGFLKHLETVRKNTPQTRNHRLAAVRSFFEYLGTRNVEFLEHSRRVTSIPSKRVETPQTRYLERDEVEALLAQFENGTVGSIGHYALLLFLYNTGARAQEAADLRIDQLELSPPFRARIRGKGGKWRVCPLWESTAKTIKVMLSQRGNLASESPVFINRAGRPLSRFGIHHITKRYGRRVQGSLPSLSPRGLNPHVLRHSTAVHLLEAGVEINVIRGWLGHSSLETTNRYAEINVRTKERALRACTISDGAAEARTNHPRWKKDTELLSWLKSL